MLHPVYAATRRAGLMGSGRGAYMIRYASTYRPGVPPPGGNGTPRSGFAHWATRAATLAAVVVTVQSGKSLFAEQATKEPTMDLLDLETENNVTPETAQESVIKNRNAFSGVGASMVPFEQAHLIPVNGEALTYVDPRPFRHMAMNDLLSRFAVYSMCCIPKLIDAAPGLLDWGLTTSIPGVNLVTTWLIKKTFFKLVCMLVIIIIIEPWGCHSD